jgi:hypothetical protein
VIERRYVAQGKAEGMAEGMERGRAQALAEALLLLADGRHLPVTDDQRRTILACQDPVRLERWLRLAVTAGSVSDVLGAE